MNKSSGSTRRRVGRSLVALAALGAVTVPASAAGAGTAFGQLATLPAGSAMGLQIDGVVLLHRGAGGTTGRVVLRGLEAGMTYAVHLHKEACSFPGNPGGGHYQDVVGGLGAPPNELWLASSTDPTAGVTAYPGGVGVGRGTVDWVARAEARAVVVHFIPPGGTTAGGPKIACADLA